MSAVWRGGGGLSFFFPSQFVGGSISFVIDAATCRDVFFLIRQYTLTT